MAKRYAPAQQDISARHNRLMYTGETVVVALTSRTVRDFIHHQERFLNLHATKQPSTITKTTSIPSADLPPAPHQPAVLPPPDYPLMEYMPTPSTAGTKVLKGRTDIMTPLSGLNHHCHLCYCLCCRCLVSGAERVS
ncbi:hypothetical protein SKAU_G00103320 [Synaphobranchus kaupii]|uniref:Uncharacterized protein n=1 Tax=Synaphobranchus kaupii TaxID=118154 RepID=A0A9Q1FZL8_SYNKA|nr:hypothetical protein SKAU_G00103320 [Synaphobranchus kaupii]